MADVKFTLQNAMAVLVAGATGAVVWQDTDSETIQKARKIVGAHAKNVLKEHRKEMRQHND